jgi:hypothetical protein
MSFRSRRLHSQMSRSRAALNRPWLTSSPDDLAASPQPSRSARNVVVVQTFAVDGPPGLGVHHWEIHVAPDADAVPVVVVTRDKTLYTRALALEGDESVRVAIAFHPSTYPDGTTCLVLDRIEEIHV